MGRGVRRAGRVAVSSRLTWTFSARAGFRPGAVPWRRRRNSTAARLLSAAALRSALHPPRTGRGTRLPQWPGPANGRHLRHR
ncbi:hypothetical protein [Streptomyces tropicalis]|uniref:Secreted protein n=1 Tax=Streptomyces tropicalis TaxID=3034234 RepID=A0ABT6A2W2_9ACTN|nr:hypothetical protein [Streptomyces tropicalis]MDF3298993.1 hypothetical protein [Streptomyces tropicalis]